MFLWSRVKNCAFVDYDNEAAAAQAQLQMHRCDNIHALGLEIDILSAVGIS